MRFIITKLALVLIALAPLANLTTPAAHAFGGEELPNGNPWHHYDITRRGAAGDICFMDTSDHQNIPKRCYLKSDKAKAIATKQPLSGASPFLENPAMGKYASSVSFESYAGAGFSRDAAEALAWHADWVDSYLYNPLFWLQGLNQDRPTHRTKVAFASYEALVKLHFDDNFSASAVRSAWNRYADGTLLALVYGAEQYRLAKTAKERRRWLHFGFNAMGTSLHALQDFYSHSTWLNAADRREKTWLNYTPAQRARIPLRTGSYDVPHTHAPIAHGDFGYACTIYSQAELKKTLGVACGGLSPMHASSLCRTYKACKKAKGVNMRSFSIDFRQHMKKRRMLYALPPGINMDNSLLARVGIKERGRAMQNANRVYPWITPARCTSIINRKVPKRTGVRFTSTPMTCADNNAHQAQAFRMFANTKHLAIRMTEDWLIALEQLMLEEARRGRKPALRTYWRALKQYQHSGNADTENGLRYAQFERFENLPYQFQTAGDYPVKNTAAIDGTYLRLEIKTADRSKAGTDGDIRVTAGGKTTLLDFAPTQTKGANGSTKPDAPIRLLAYNDFERNSHASYVIGPFKKIPQKITFSNGDADAVDVLKAVGSDIKNSFKRLGPKLKRAGLGIIAGNADHIETNHVTWNRDTLDRKRQFSININGGKEGHYRIEGKIIPKGFNAQGWRKFDIRMTKMVCIKDAPWTHEKGRDDEPFFILVVSDLKRDKAQHKIAGPYNGIVSGKTRTMRQTFPVEVPPYGYVTLAVKGMESDQESAAMRRGLAREFATGVSDADRLPRAKFLDALGRAIAPDWKVESIKVIAFQRGERLALGQVAYMNRQRWVKGGKQLSLNLRTGRMRPLKVSARNAFVKRRPEKMGAVQIRQFNLPQQPLTPMKPLQPMKIEPTKIRPTKIKPIKP